MTKLLSAIFVHLLSAFAVLQLFVSLPKIDRDQTSWQLATAVMCIILAAAIFWEIYSYRLSAPKRFRYFKEFRIKRYMCKWLGSGGRAVIFTRDMTWAHEDPIRSALFEKARRNELTICIEHPLPLAAELQEAGAEVISYGELNVVPRSRYTIIDYQSDRARVAVGGAVGEHHEIQEFRNGDHPFFGVAEDLAKILIAYKRKQDAAAS